MITVEGGRTGGMENKWFLEMRIYKYGLKYWMGLLSQNLCLSVNIFTVIWFQYRKTGQMQSSGTYLSPLRSCPHFYFVAPATEQEIKFVVKYFKNIKLAMTICRRIVQIHYRGNRIASGSCCYSQYLRVK